MNHLLGASLGLLGGSGLVIAIANTPPLRRLSLADRIAPYVTDKATAADMLGKFAAPTTVVQRLTMPLLRDAARLVDRIFGGHESVRRRLRGIGSPLTVEQFRVQQVIAGALGLGAGIILAGLFVLLGQSNLLLLLALAGGCSIAGLLARDWWLSQLMARRERDILAEFPVIAEMLALAVTAGQGPLRAINEVTKLTRGHLTDLLNAIAANVRAGTPLQQALIDARDAADLEPLSRFFDSLAIAIDRGTPIAAVLRAQAADARALSKRQLLETGGRKEVLMMVPVVFCVLPVTIIFAFYPGLLAIVTVAQ